MKEALGIPKRFGNNIINKIIIEVIIWLVICCIIAGILYGTLWNNYQGQAHSILELVCIFIALSAFLTFWNTTRYQSSQNYILIFWILIIAAFDALHAYYYVTLKLYPVGYYDLSIRFYCLGRIAEVFVLMFGIKQVNKHFINKYQALLISILIIIITSFILLKFPNVFPRVVTPNMGVTKSKIIFEYTIIIFYFIILYQLISKIDYKEFISYKYLIIAVLLAIPAEFCFTLYKSSDSFYFIYGHFIRIICYFYIYRGIFVSAVTHPYIEIEKMISRDRIKGAFDYVNIGVALTDLKANILGVNKYFCEMLGYTEEELLNLQFIDITVRGDKYINEKIISDLIDSNIYKNDYEKRYVNKLGGEVNVRVSNTLVYDMNNKPLYVVCEIQDISSIKKIVELEEEIEKEKKILKETLELDKLEQNFLPIYPMNLEHL